MFKRMLAAALMVGGIVAIPAQASLVLWEINPSGSMTPTGSFYFDTQATSNPYSNVDVWGTMFVTHYTSGSGTDRYLTMTCCFLNNANLTLYFADSLRTATEVAFRSSESLLWGVLRVSGRGTATDPPPPPNGAVTVPEPGTLMLLGAGLAALGLMRRRKSA